jgi:hypothetical protein
MGMLASSEAKGYIVRPARNQEVVS